jgi:hypothetical protein
MKTEYRTVWVEYINIGQLHAAFDREVNALLSEGWELCGGPQMANVAAMQALVRRVEK